jgi:hypothetical protein
MGTALGAANRREADGVTCACVEWMSSLGWVAAARHLAHAGRADTKGQPGQPGRPGQPGQPGQRGNRGEQGTGASIRVEVKEDFYPVDLLAGRVATTPPVQVEWASFCPCLGEGTAVIGVLSGETSKNRLELK